MLKYLMVFIVCLFAVPCHSWGGDDLVEQRPARKYCPEPESVVHFVKNHSGKMVMISSAVSFVVSGTVGLAKWHYGEQIPHGAVVAAIVSASSFALSVLIPDEWNGHCSWLTGCYNRCKRKEEGYGNL